VESQRVAEVDASGDQNISGGHLVQSRRLGGSAGSLSKCQFSLRFIEDGRQ
jgi:hypothetical protein